MKWQFEMYTNFRLEECFKFEHLKRIDENLLRTICKIKRDIQTYDQEDIKNVEYWEDYLYVCLKMKRGSGTEDIYLCFILATGLFRKNKHDEKF